MHECVEKSIFGVGGAPLRTPHGLITESDTSADKLSVDQRQDLSGVLYILDKETALGRQSAYLRIRPAYKDLEFGSFYYYSSEIF